MLSFFAVATLALPLLAFADLVPTAPGPGDVFKQGDQCTINWTADTSGKWKQTNIELMTGPNQQMIHLATVATVDGTDPTKTSISVPCLGVSPNSPIYFYQFTAEGQNATWTGRFAISDASGATTQPQNANQPPPDGGAIPWGTGKLLDASQGSPPPPTAPSGQIDGSSGAAAPGGNSTSSSVSGALPGTSLSTASTSLPVVTPAPSSSAAVTPTSSSSISTVRAASTAAASKTSSASPSTSSNAAAAINPRSAFPAFVAAAILGFMGL